MSAVQLPRWRCHKVVSAAKILNITTTESARGGHSVRWMHLEGVAKPVEISAAWAGRQPPVVGGYYVVYDDGYESWSPAKAFEEGYTRLDEKNAALLGIGKAVDDSLKPGFGGEP